MAQLTAFQELHDWCTPPWSKAFRVPVSNTNVDSYVAWAPAASLEAESLRLAQMHGVRTTEGPPGSRRSWDPLSLQDTCRCFLPDPEWRPSCLPSPGDTREHTSPKTQPHLWGQRSPPTSQMSGNRDRSKAASTCLPLTLQTSSRALMNCSRSPSDLHAKPRPSRPCGHPKQGRSVGRSRGLGQWRSPGRVRRHQPWGLCTPAHPSPLSQPPVS